MQAIIKRNKLGLDLHKHGMPVHSDKSAKFQVTNLPPPFEKSDMSSNRPSSANIKKYITLSCLGLKIISNGDQILTGKRTLSRRNEIPLSLQF